MPLEGITLKATFRELKGTIKGISENPTDLEELSHPKQESYR